MTSSRFIDPLTDFGFKRIFGSEPNKDLLIDFLNQLFNGEFEIKDLTFNKQEHLGDLVADRKAIFDLLCTATDGRQFIVEVQRVDQQYFKDRCLFYTSSLIREQAPRSSPNWNYHLKPVYLIGLMDFAWKDMPSHEFLHRVKLVKLETGDVFYDKLGFIFIEISKFDKMENELVTPLDYWFFVLKNLSRLEKIPLILRKKVFSKLFKIAEVINLTKIEKMAYDQSLKVKWDNYSTQTFAEGEIKRIKEVSERRLEEAIKQGREEALAEGRREGIAKGLQEGVFKGLQEGISKGREEEKLELALEMKKRQLDIMLISELTGLSLEVINNL